MKMEFRNFVGYHKYRRLCSGMWTVLLVGMLACSCGKEEAITEPPTDEEEETEQPVQPEEIEENPLDGVWTEENADGLASGQERRLTFNNDSTYSIDVYSSDGVLVRNDQAGSYEVTGENMKFDGYAERKFEVDDNYLTLFAPSNGEDKERLYLRSDYAGDIVPASKLVLDMDEPMLTAEELAAFKGFMIYNSDLQVPTTAQYDNTWVFRKLGKGMDAVTKLFEITYDLTFLNRVIEYADAALYTRNGQPGGDFRIVSWLGTPEDIWPSTDQEEEEIDGAVEQGAVLARIAYCARLILQLPDIWDMRVAANDRYRYGTTYKERALKYLDMCDKMYDDWLTRFINPGDNVFYRRDGDGLIEPIAWNQALMACDGLTYMSECHEILGNTSKVELYDGLVRDNLEYFIEDSWTIKTENGKECLQWRYSKVADRVKHAEDLNHAALVSNVLYNIYLSGHHADLMNDVMTKLCNTMVDFIFTPEFKNANGRFPGRINGAYEGKYMDGYIRDYYVKLADVRKDWLEYVIEVNGTRWYGELSYNGYALWCKSRRLTPPQDIKVNFTVKGEAELSWKSLSSGTVKVLRSFDLWNWSEIGEPAASDGTYTDNGTLTREKVYYRLVLVKDGEAGYSQLVSASKN